MTKIISLLLALLLVAALVQAKDDWVDDWDKDSDWDDGFFGPDDNDGGIDGDDHGDGDYGDGDHGDGDHGSGMSGDGDHGDGDYGSGDLGSGGISGDDDHAHDDDDDNDWNDDDDDWNDDDDSDLMQPLFGRPKSKKGKHKASKKNCHFKNCAVCGVFECRRCSKGYSLTTTSFIKRCISNCPPGQRNIGGKCKKPRQRGACRQIPHCQECPGISWLRSCRKCEKGWYRYRGTFDLKSRCVKKCPRGFKGKRNARGSSCVKTQLKCPLMPGCVKCPRADSCVKCARNLSLHNGMLKSKCLKKCPPGYDNAIKNGANVCQLEEGCNDRFCGTCKTGWFKLKYKGRKCHKQCPRGYYVVGKRFCTRCRRGCTKCSSMLRCDSCSKGSSMFTRTILGATISSKCIARCPHGYRKELVKGTGYVCRQVCLVANCRTCPKVGHHGLYHHCDSCKPGHHLLHKFFNDRCVSRCPAGYHVEKVQIGTICRIDGPRPTTWAPEPETTTAEPEMTTPEPETTMPEPETTTAEPETTTAEPETTTPEPEMTTAEPEMTTAEPETTRAEPETTPLEPTTFTPDSTTQGPRVNETSVMGGIPYPFPDP